VAHRPPPLSPFATPARSPFPSPVAPLPLPARSQHYRASQRLHNQSFIDLAVQRNRTAEFDGVLKTTTEVLTPMSAVTRAALRAIGTGVVDDKEDDTGASIDLLAPARSQVSHLGRVWERYVDATVTCEERKEALRTCVAAIHARDAATKVVIFTPDEGAAFDAALAALRSASVGGVISYAAGGDGTVIDLWKQPDVLASDKAKPRVLVLPFVYAAGHNFQGVRLAPSLATSLLASTAGASTLASSALTRPSLVSLRPLPPPPRRSARTS
jgi:hypothetical protein